MVYLVVYDLNGDNSNESAIVETINRLGITNPCLGNSLLVAGESDLNSVYDAIAPLLKAGDRFFVCQLSTGHNGGRTFKSDRVWDWLSKHLA